MSWTTKTLRNRGQWRLVERSKQGIGGPITTYEVWKMRTWGKDQHINGKLAHRKGDERFPKSSEWGVYGWTYCSEEEAIRDLVEKES